VGNENVIANVVTASSVTLDYSAGIIQVDATANPVTLNLPPWNEAPAGWRFAIIKVDGTPNLVTINGWQAGPPDYGTDTMSGGPNPSTTGSSPQTLGQAIPQIQDPDGPGTIPGVMSYDLVANTAANVDAGYPAWLMTATSFAQ